MPPTIVTANRLTDGSVVFLDAQGQWVVSMRDAEVFAEGGDAAALQRAKRDEEHQMIVDPYPIEVVERDGRSTPKTLREAIRANGPTVRPDLKTHQS